MQYREILAQKGIRFEDCEVLAFEFKQNGVRSFHFYLLNNWPFVIYYSFDCWDKYAYVVVPKDEKNAAVIIAIATKNGGEKITPNLQ